MITTPLVVGKAIRPLCKVNFLGGALESASERSVWCTLCSPEFTEGRLALLRSASVHTVAPEPLR
jgi:hypothetical protein